MSEVRGEAPTAADVAAYFDRIGFEGSAKPTLDTLRALQWAHCWRVPFENLDIHLGRAIEIDPERSFEKVVDAGRGGFCYELNALFGTLLAELGFDVTVLEGRVVRNGAPGDSFSHLMLQVDLDRPWLVDVGFGDGSFYPLALDETDEQWNEAGGFRIERNGATYAMWSKTFTPEFAPQYEFELVPRKFADFAERSHWTQTSVDSNFTKQVICSLPVPGGRKSVIGLELLSFIDGVRTVEALSRPERDDLLSGFFGIDLNGAVLP